MLYAIGYRLYAIRYMLYAILVPYVAEASLGRGYNVPETIKVLTCQFSSVESHPNTIHLETKTFFNEMESKSMPKLHQQSMPKLVSNLFWGKASIIMFFLMV